MTKDENTRIKHLSKMAYIHNKSGKKLTYNEIHELKQLIYLRAYPFQKFKLYFKSKTSFFTLLLIRWYKNFKEYKPTF